MWGCIDKFIVINHLQNSVSEWLNLLRLPEYTSSLERQGYADIDSVTDITWEDLEDIGITKLGKDVILLSWSPSICTEWRPFILPVFSCYLAQLSLPSGNWLFSLSPHNVALVSEEPLLYRFCESLLKINEGRKSNISSSGVMIRHKYWRHSMSSSVIAGISAWTW